jgi:hypothetical protein
MKKNYMLLCATIVLLISISVNVKAQDNSNSNFGPRNYINAYVGVVEYNINYERNLIQKSKSFSNVRIGFGHASILIAGEGKYINAAVVHLIGKKNSHLEINLGMKYMVTNSISDPKFSETYIPEAFLGYRFEKPSQGLIFRVGVSYPTLINIGVGYKF